MHIGSKVKTTTNYFKNFKNHYKGVVVDRDKNDIYTIKLDCGCLKSFHASWIESDTPCLCSCHNHHKTEC